MNELAFRMERTLSLTLRGNRAASYVLYTSVGAQGVVYQLQRTAKTANARDTPSASTLEVKEAK